MSSVLSDLVTTELYLSGRNRNQSKNVIDYKYDERKIVHYQIIFWRSNGIFGE
jgi:hypothetical protein